MDEQDLRLSIWKGDTERRTIRAITKYVQGFNKAGEEHNPPPSDLFGTKLESANIKAVMEHPRHFCKLDRDGYDLMMPFITKKCR